MSQNKDVELPPEMPEIIRHLDRGVISSAFPDRVIWFENGACMTLMQWGPIGGEWSRIDIPHDMLRGMNTSGAIELIQTEIAIFNVTGE